MKRSNLGKCDMVLGVLRVEKSCCRAEMNNARLAPFKASYRIVVEDERCSLRVRC